MLSISDIKEKQMILLNNLEGGYHLCISQGNIIIKNKDSDETLTKITRHKAMALMIIGYCTLTNVLIEFCQKYGIALILLNSRLRPILFVSSFGEANYLLRQRQYAIGDNQALNFAKHFIEQKANNSITLLKGIRKKDDELRQMIETLADYQRQIDQTKRLDELMGIEGNIAKSYFKYHFGQLKHTSWQGRKPRLKIDPVNVVLDMGYTLLFNYIEINLRLFGFDVYKGMLHQLWYKRKSLVCDLVEPFRCIVDKQVLTSFNLGQFKTEHFNQIKMQYQLKTEHQRIYNAILMQAIIAHKVPIFVYIRDFYRAYVKYADKDMAFDELVLMLPSFDIQANGEDV